MSGADSSSSVRCSKSTRTASEFDSADLCVGMTASHWPRTLRADEPQALDSSTSGKRRAIFRTVSKSIFVRDICPKRDRKSTRLNSSHGYISYAVFCLKKKKTHSESILATECD